MGKKAQVGETVAGGLFHIGGYPTYNGCTCSMYRHSRASAGCLHEPTDGTKVGQLRRGWPERKKFLFSQPSLCRHASRYRQASPRYLAALVPLLILLSTPPVSPTTPTTRRPTRPTPTPSSFSSALTRSDLTAHTPRHLLARPLIHTNLRRHGSHARPVSLCHPERFRRCLRYGCTSFSLLEAAAAVAVAATPATRAISVARRSAAAAAARRSAITNGWH